ncbi:MAG: hypothetical protein J6A05_03750 [Oscillospiraceae bacterium]|nr:hypothetical protein [Oscillospiraceae bacterium]
MSDKIHVAVVGAGNKLTGVIAQSGGSFPKYEGAYEVTPSMKNDITLETAKKVMTDNVTVKKIPRYDVSNEAGGTTIYIATKEVQNG